ncbi:uncharacterized protein PSFLO_06567 [Pseudozyma flocculosa]|nr:uncharacterized protein PSFLO_06567 [Pseudozyma flocculosa]
MPGIRLPAEDPSPNARGALRDDLRPAAGPASGTRSRSSSFAADDQSRSTGSSRSNSRRSTPRANSAAFAKGAHHPAPTVDPITGVELDSPHEDPRALKYELPSDIPVPSFGKRTKDLERDLGRLYEAVAGARRIAVICGAGISVSSPANIPDFRSATGLFKRLKEQHPTAGLSSGKDLFDARLFSSESTSALFYSMIAELKGLADQAQPTIFHRFLKRLDEEGRLQRVYTQNIDGLEQKAGLTFGLGETGDSTSTFRALGKRKRQGGGAAGAGGWSRSKSDSALLASKREEGEPMFPRTIPLHGTLQTLTCALCSHKVIMGDTTQADVVQPDREPTELITAFTPQETLDALELLKQGEAVPCPKCTTEDEVRQVAGLRSRGVGRMKTDVVLYGGQNEGAERVGECLQRDILGLRDPFETAVPESLREIRARERKEKREADKRMQDEEKARAAAAAAAAREAVKAEGTDDSFDAALVETQLGGEADPDTSICDVSMDKDDILARAFEEDDEPKDERKPVGLAPIAEDASVKFEEPAKPARPQRAPRAARLKPLPPDLLIVAGTSLKVPGTKRIVREFAKACHARDTRYYHTDSNDDEDDDNDEGDGDDEGKPGKGKGRRRTRSRSASADKEGAAGAGGQDSDEDDDDDDDPNAPIRTILLNYDFPVPAAQWEDVFDVWVQGDLQRAALGVFPPREVVPGASVVQREIESVCSQYSWQALKMALDEQRAMSKKKGRKGATARGSASMSRSVSRDDGDVLNGTAPASRAFPGRASGRTWGRSQSESVIKRQRASEIGEASKPTAAAAKGRAGSMKRTTSKKSAPTSAAAATATAASTKADARANAKDNSKGNGDGNGKGGSGKGRGGVGQKGARTATTTTISSGRRGSAGVAAASAAAVDSDSGLSDLSSVSGHHAASTGFIASCSRSGGKRLEREKLVAVVVTSSTAPPTPPPSMPSAESTPEPSESPSSLLQQQRQQQHCTPKQPRSSLGRFVKSPAADADVDAAVADGTQADGLPSLPTKRTLTRTRSRGAR